MRSRSVFGRSRVLLLALLALLLGLSVPLLAQPEAPSAEDLAAAVERLADRFEVLKLSDGYLLRPLEEATFETIELRGNRVAIDGELISAARLRDVLGEDAERLAPWLYREPLREDPSSEQGRAVDPIEEKPIEVSPIDRSGEDLEDRLSVVRQGRDRTTLFEDVVIEVDESVRDVVVLFGSLKVEGEVRNVVVIGNKAKIRGRVQGDLTVVGGSIELLSGAEIYGDIVSVGSSIDADDEAQTFGEVTEVAMGSFEIDDDWPSFDWRFNGGWGPFSLGAVFGKVFNTILLALVVLLLFWLARDYVGSVAQRVRLEPWKAGFVGLITQLIFLPALLFVVVVLVISVVGIPLAVLIAPISLMLLFLALLVGYSSVALVAGHFLERRFSLRSVGPFLGIAIGLLLIQSWSILGEALMFVPGPIKISAVLLLLLGGLVKYLSWTLGLGAVLLRHFSPLPAEAAWLPPSPVDSDAWDESEL